MAESVLGLVIHHLGSLIIEEIKSLGALRKQVERVKNELEIIRPFLKNADEKAAAEELDQGQSNEGIRIWVQQIREEAYRIEDVLDEFTFLVAQVRHGAGLAGVLPRCCYCMKMQKLHHKIASDIKDIMSSLEKINERTQRYDLKFIEEGSRNGMTNVKHDSNGARSYSIEEGHLVGNEAIRKELIAWLINERPQRGVLALVGAGGLGKTTLVASVYKRPVVRNCFDCYAWIEVGRAYNKDVFRTLLRQFSCSRKEPPRDNIDTMDSRELIDSLREYLKEKRYMVVFDDVQQADFWKHVEHALLDNGKASRIFITARNRAVADIIPGSSDHIRVRVLEGLPLDKAWQLFCKKAFSDGVCPPHLEKLSHDILEKCDGLPLAIVAVGDLLSKKNKVENEWQELLNNLGSELERDIYLKDCNRVLCESYNDLPHHLKPCLLYFTLFPASYITECERLIRLWIAEGFVQLQDNKNKLHEVAEGYLTELIHRSLVQVSETSIDGKATSVRVHELMYEIIRRKAKQFGFSQLLKEQEEQDLSQQRKTRRIAVHKSTTNVVESVKDSKVRSIFLFDIEELPYTFICGLISANFMLMKVLDFQGAPLHRNLPKEVGNLFNLRYLSFRKTKVAVLPKSIGKLLNLDTLDLRHTLVRDLPNDIRNLKKLRCLLGGQLDQLDHTHGGGIRVQEAIGSLTALQELTFVEADYKVTKELGKLRKLKKLGLRVTKGKGKDLCASISNMEDLKSLDVESMDRDETINLQAIASPPQYLDHLYLTGILKKLPDWISNLKNLVKMRLAQSGLTDDPLRFLHGLPNLMELSLVETYNAKHLHFAEGWFPKLLHLTLVGFKELKSMIVDDGAMPLLQSLKIESSPILKAATGISNLKNLIEMELVDMSKEFVHGIVNSDLSCKVFVSRVVEGKIITETKNPPLSLELLQTRKHDDEGKDLNEKYYSPLVQPELHQAIKDDKGKHIIDKDYTPSKVPGLQQASKNDEQGKHIIVKDEEEGKDLSEKDHSPLVQPKLQQASKDDEQGKHIIEKDDEKENDLIEKDHSPLVQLELQQASNDGEQGKHIIEKDDEEGKDLIENDYSPLVQPEHQQASKDDEHEKHIIETDDEEGNDLDEKEKDLIEKDHSPLVQLELQQANKDDEQGTHVIGKDDEEGKYQIEKDRSPLLQLELQQSSMDDEQGKHIIGKDDEKGNDLIKKDHSPLVQPELQQAGKDDEQGKQIIEKDDEEGKDLIEKNHSPLIQPELQQASKDDEQGKHIIEKDDEEGKDLIEKDHKPLVQLELQQASKDDEQGKHIIENDDKEVEDLIENDHSPLVQPELQASKKDEQGKQVIEKDDKEGKDLIENDHSPLVQLELQQTSKDNEQGKHIVEMDDKEGKDLIEKDHSPLVKPELQQASRDGEQGKHIIENDDKEGKDLIKKDHSPLVQFELRQTSRVDEQRKHIIEKDDEEGKDRIEKDHSPLVQLELQQASRDDEQRNHITEKDDEEKNDLIKKDHSSLVQPQLQHASKDDEQGKHIIEKDDEEGKDLIEKDHSPIVQPELQQASKDDEQGNDVIEKDGEEGKDLIEKDHSPLVQSELQQTSKDDEQGKQIIEKDYTASSILPEKDHGVSIQSEPNLTTKKQWGKNFARWSRNLDVTKDEKGKQALPELQETSKDDEERKNITTKDYSSPAQPELRQPMKDLVNALRKRHSGVTKP